MHSEGTGLTLRWSRLGGQVSEVESARRSGAFGDSVTSSLSRRGSRAAQVSRTPCVHVRLEEGVQPPARLVRRRGSDLRGPGPAGRRAVAREGSGVTRAVVIPAGERAGASPTTQTPVWRLVPTPRPCRRRRVA